MTGHPASEILDYARTFAQFPVALRRFLEHPLTLGEARRVVRERMERRDESFLHLVERSVYGHAGSPYLALLKHAGCELGDLTGLVRQKGLEGALYSLREQGVYVTYEELRGRRPIVRNGLTLEVAARDFDNPHTRRDFSTATSGSTGLALTVHQNLELLADETPFRRLMLEAHGLFGAPIVLWSAFLPGAALRGVLMYARMRQPVEKWFAPSGWRDSRYWVQCGLVTVYMLFSLRAFGYRIPFPQVVRLDRADVVARHLHQLLQTHATCVLFAWPSTALRVAIAARDLGLDLTGCVFFVTGEPITATRAEQMQQAGGRIISAYGMAEAGMIGYGCGNPVDPTDVHVQSDALALFSYPYVVEGTDVSVPAFNVTTLLDSAPKVLINVQTDDYGIVEERACGCELGLCGYTPHLRQIHSYTKLVGEGVTLIGNEMVQIVEQVLPARFGGSALDYQLLEEEDERGFTRLYLLISPRVEIEDEQAVLDVMHRALSDSSSMGDTARSIWQQAQTIQIRRQEPVVSENTKLLPLHIRRQPRDLVPHG
jgi:hypothetical protein